MFQNSQLQMEINSPILSATYMHMHENALLLL